RKLTAAEIDEMVVLYRRAATHLSVVRSRSADPTLVAWLSHLGLQARAAITPSSGFSANAIARFFTVSFPAEVYRCAGWWLGVAAGFLGLTGVLIAMVATDEQIALSFLSQSEIDQLVTNDFEAYYSERPPPNFAALVWTNNTFVSAICLAGGVLILPTLYMLWVNALNLGVVGGIMVGNGRSDVFFGLITMYGLHDLTSTDIASRMGLRIGYSRISNGPLCMRMRTGGKAGRYVMVVLIFRTLLRLGKGLID